MNARKLIELLDEWAPNLKVVVSCGGKFRRIYGTTKLRTIYLDKELQCISTADPEGSFYIFLPQEPQEGSSNGSSGRAEPSKEEKNRVTGQEALTEESKQTYEQ